MNNARTFPRKRHLMSLALLVVFALGGAFAVAGAARPGDGDVPVAGESAAAAAPCNYYYEWTGKVRFPLQPDPHATYTYVAPSSQAADDGIGFLVRGEYIHGAWTSWLTYTVGAQPFSGANFVDNPPEKTNDPVQPDSGSINPFKRGQPMLGSPRDFSLLFVKKGYKESNLPPSLDGTASADIIATGNIREYPVKGDFWMLANRDYQAFSGGYNPGGTTKDTFPVVTAVDLATGEAVDCQAYNLLPDKLQRPPTDPPDALNYGRVPIDIALKNGSHFDPLGGLGRGPHSQFGPKNPRGLVQFARAPIGPGADVAKAPPTQNCAGYLATRTSTRLVSLVRVPRIANYTDTEDVTASSTYPNPVRPQRPWQAAYVSFSLYGSSSGFYLPGEHETMSVADQELQVDGTGGSTVLVWPRDLRKREQSRVFAYAEQNAWPIVRGGTSGRQASANVLIRVKGAKSSYRGAIENLPCYFDDPKNAKKDWSEIPVEVGSEWVATSENLGRAAPQGVTCRSIRALQTGRCLRNLKQHIRTTGGHYYARSGR